MVNDKFLKSSLERLEMGAAEYGDESFHKKDPELLREVSEELFDVATWCSIWACRYSSKSPASIKLEKIAKGAKYLHAELQKSWRELPEELKRERSKHDPGVAAATEWLERCLE